MKEISFTDKNMEMESLYMLMAQYIQETSKITKKKAKEYKNGQMVDVTTELGIKNNSMEKEHSHGMTAENIQETIFSIKRMGQVSLIGPMAAHIMDFGKMECNMGLENIKDNQERNYVVNGKKARKSEQSNKMNLSK